MSPTNTANAEMPQHTALVTGSSRGIGLATALALAERGFAVAVNGPTDDDELAAAVARVAALGVTAYKLPGDVSDISGHDDLLARAEAGIGPLSTLVNNAGVTVLKRGDLLEVSEASYDRCMAANAKAPFFLTQAFAKRLLDRRRDDGRFYSVVSVTSVNAVAASIPRGEYCASKAAAAMTAQVFAARLGGEGIAVYDVRPGLIDTDMTKTVIDSYRERAEQGLTLIPRVGKPDDVGSVIASLASSTLPYSTGQVVCVDGGLMVARF